jgi:hypothetical protein
VEKFIILTESAQVKLLNILAQCKPNLTIAESISIYTELQNSERLTASEVQGKFSVGTSEENE